MGSQSANIENLELQLRYACTELNRRLRAGNGCSAEELLDTFPALRSRSELVMELIYTEFLVRQQLGETIVPERWYERFPEWRQDLQQLFEVHQMVCDNELAPRRVGDTSEVLRSAEQTMQEEHRVAASPRRIGNYELLEEVGRGGMGVVYRARQIGLNRVVAIKMILAGEHASPSELARFRKEAEAAARLQHPGIVQIHEVGTHDELPYFSMEFVEGGSLLGLLSELAECDAKATPVGERSTDTPSQKPKLLGGRNERSARFPADSAAQLIETVARTVHYAHQQGVIHRDLKPANVLLQAVDGRQSKISSHGSLAIESSSRSGGSRALGFNPKITDFGLAKCLSEGNGDRTRTGAMLGTPAYMAPEQAYGKTGGTGPTTDVYALGAILYELLTGRTPFQGNSPLETLEQVRTREPVRPSRLEPGLARDLETICLKCLEKDPARRYASAEMLADDLRRYRDGEPIHAEAVDFTDRLVKWAKRRPAIAGLAATVLAVTLAGFVGVSWQWRRAEGRRVEAVNALHKADQARQAAVEQQRMAQQARLDAEADESNAKRRLYFHRIALAEGEWQNYQATSADQILNDCPPEYRDWEWHYLKTLCRDELITMSGHTNAVQCVVYSPDGTHIASGSGEWGTNQIGEVIIWDAETGKSEFGTLTGHGGPIRGLAFSPDGKKLASCAISWSRRPGGVIVWDVTTGKPLFSLAEPGASAHGVAFSPDGRLLAAAHWDRMIRIWSAEDGSLIRTLEGHSGITFDVAFSPDGRLVASVGREGACYVWDVATGERQYEFTGYGDLRNVSFSPDGRYLAFNQWGDILQVWNITSRLAHRSRHVSFL